MFVHDLGVLLDKLTVTLLGAPWVLRHAFDSPSATVWTGEVLEPGKPEESRREATKWRPEGSGKELTT